MSLGSRIRAARVAKGWSQAKLGAAVGKAANTIWSWETGRTEPTRDDVARTASRLGVPLAELEDVQYDQFPIEIVRVPLLSWVSAGQVSEVGSLDAASAEEQLAVADLPPGDWFATTVRGDSMDRVSPEGSRILVNVADKRLVAGKAFVFSLRGETTYKFFQRDPVPRLEPYSTNPSNRTIFLEERDTWTVVGRVWRSYIDLH
jgi:transcriptional regulator with XRE-family HTH domain